MSKTGDNPHVSILHARSQELGRKHAGIPSFSHEDAPRLIADGDGGDFDSVEFAL